MRGYFQYPEGLFNRIDWSCFALLHPIMDRIIAMGVLFKEDWSLDNKLFKRGEEKSIIFYGKAILYLVNTENTYSK